MACASYNTHNLERTTRALVQTYEYSYTSGQWGALLEHEVDEVLVLPHADVVVHFREQVARARLGDAQVLELLAHVGQVLRLLDERADEQRVLREALEHARVQLGEVVAATDRIALHLLRAQQPAPSTRSVSSIKSLLEPY